MAESFDAVLAEMRDRFDDDREAFDEFKVRLLVAREAEVAERDRAVRQANSHAEHFERQYYLESDRADRAVALLREIPSVLAYAMNLCNSQASEALQDESARQINSCNARIREVLSEQAGERENVTKESAHED